MKQALDMMHATQPQLSPLSPARPGTIRTVAQAVLRRSQQLALSQNARGRMLLHLLALRRDGNFGWHFAGILRELRTVHLFPHIHW